MYHKCDRNLTMILILVLIVYVTKIKWLLLTNYNQIISVYLYEIRENIINDFFAIRF